jgi:hypothetical protein
VIAALLVVAAVEAAWADAHFDTPDMRARREKIDRLVEICEDAAAREGTVEAHFWAAIAWGEWTTVHTSVRAGLEDAAGKIRDHAQAVLRGDPSFRDGAGARLLGRLHAKAPRIPAFTGWVDRDEGIRLLRQALAISRSDPRNAYFLAEALLDHDPSAAQEARALLREVAAREPSGPHAREELETILAARSRLEALP